MNARDYLDMAARAALRGRGDVEPNPMVGAVIVKDGRVLGIGHHRRFGDLHAEREALKNCRGNGHDPRGSTIYVTLEPCSHTGKQPPCVDAIVESGIEKVVMAIQDPNPVSGGGLKKLEAAGIAVEICRESSLAVNVSRIFRRQVAPAAGRQGLPWVIAKWAQTLDGKIATRDGESKWISNPLSRRRVHRLRSRVDAIMTGIGTVLTDDPLLTARDVSRVRRIARRVVLDSRLRIPLTSQLVRTASEAPVIVIAASESLSDPDMRGRRLQLEEAGVEVRGVGSIGDQVDAQRALMLLSSEFGCTNVMVECGPQLLGSLFSADLVDEAIVYLAPMVIGDDEAASSVGGRSAPRLSQARRLELVRAKQLRDDLELLYRRRS